MRIIRALTLAGVLGSLLVPTSVGQTHFQTLYMIPNGNPLGLTAGNGVFYGTTWDGTGPTSTCGTIFEMQPPAASGGAWTEIVLHSFTHGNGDACVPAAPPVLGPNGVLYGVTFRGGSYGHGAIYQVQPPASPGAPWTESVIYSFAIPACSPKTTSSLVIDTSGTLFFAALSGGAYGAGELLQLQPPASPGGTWTETLLYSFPVNAGNPTSLFAGANGDFYGAIAYGGTGPTKAGAVYHLAPPSAPGGTWTGSLLYNFQGFADGSTPNFVTLGPNGTLYGTTYGTTWIGGGPGPIGAGTVYQLFPPASGGTSWTKTILYSFGNGNLHGPNSPPAVRNGNLYGSSSSSTGGVVYELRPPSTPGGNWTLTSLHTFTNGDIPNGIFILMQSNGTIYGATEAQATAPYSGTIYEITAH